MTDYLIDNDAVVKLVRYGLTEELEGHCCNASSSRAIGILGTARWVCKKAIDRAVGSGGETASLPADLEAFFGRVSALEPSPQEVRMAAALEDRANTRRLALDPGESQMVAMLLARTAIMITGDKRAISALDLLLDDDPNLNHVGGRIASLEHVMMTLVNHLGEVTVSEAVLRAPAADAAMRLAFRPPVTLTGLISYLADVRRSGPRILVEADSLCFEDLV